MPRKNQFVPAIAPFVISLKIPDYAASALQDATINRETAQHLVFNTKNREPFIHEDISDHLFSYIGLACHELECQPVRVGGWYDHVHILCALSWKIAVMDLVEKVNTTSSLLFKNQDYGNPEFYWQRGYAAISVTPKDSNKLVRYIENQKQHHANIGYQDECRAYFKEQGLEIDERYFGMV